ncbi:MAG: hypothetical protein ABMA25_05760 [Ilumatobacteraceae bacterium]
MAEKWKPSIVKAVEWRGEVGVGVAGAVFVTLDAVGKFDVDPSITAGVAAEYLCNRLAIACGLPVPGASLTRRTDGSIAYTSIRFGSLKQNPAPVVPAAFVAEFPDLAAGIVAFDAWTLNRDRNAGNVAYIQNVQPPMIFDHEGCLGGKDRSSIVNLVDELQTALSPGHCLAAHLTTAADLQAWTHVISGVHPRAWRTPLQELRAVRLLTAGEAKAIGEYLENRRRLLVSVLRSSLPELDWGLFL